MSLAVGVWQFWLVGIGNNPFWGLTGGAGSKECILFSGRTFFMCLGYE
jgi:hypothetical protein